MASSRPFGRRLDTTPGMIGALAAGLTLGVVLFVGALFAYMPKAPPARVLGVDGRLIGIPHNCDEARAARIAPMARGTGFYTPRLDANGDGLACESKLPF